MITQQKMLGNAPAEKVPVEKRVWFATKLALWRSKVGWEIVTKQAAEVVARCRHAPDCAGATDEHEPCLANCPDREIRMSALVMLNAARQFAPPVASKLADQPYLMPSREVFSEVIAELCACQAELEVVRGTVITVPPPAVDESPAPKLLKENESP